MSDAPKLLTEAEWAAIWNEQATTLGFAEWVKPYRERGLIAPEIDPLEKAFGEAFSDTRIGEIGGWNPIYRRFRQILKERGMELAQPTLTRDRLVLMLTEAGFGTGPVGLGFGRVDRLHAALTQVQQ